MKQPIGYQRLEAFGIFTASLYFYNYLHLNLLLFVVMLLFVDAFMLGYVFNKGIGAHIYNIGHSMILPAMVLIIGNVLGDTSLIGLSLIWFAHIGMDRALGYGLKLPTGFRYTHLGAIGKKP